MQTVANALFTAASESLGFSNNGFKTAEKVISEHSNLLEVGCMGMEEGKGACVYAYALHSSMAGPFQICFLWA